MEITERYNFWRKIHNVSLAIFCFLFVLGIVSSGFPEILRQNSTSIYFYVSVSVWKAINATIDVSLVISLIMVTFAATLAYNYKLKDLAQKAGYDPDLFRF